MLKQNKLARNAHRIVPDILRQTSSLFCKSISNREQNFLFCLDQVLPNKQRFREFTLKLNKLMWQVHPNVSDLLKTNTLAYFARASTGWHLS